LRRGEFYPLLAPHLQSIDGVGEFLMTVTRRSLLGGTLAATGWALGSMPTRSQGATDFPARDVRAVCNFAPGSRADVMVRFFAERLSALTNKNILVDNRLAENGNAGTRFVAKAKPDGYTILITPGNATLATAPVISKKPGFDPVKDFVAVTTLAKQSYAVLVDPASPAKTLSDLTIALKAKAGKATYGYTTPTSQMAAELYNKLAGTGASKVRYRDNQAIAIELASGTTDFIVMDVPWAADQVKSGKLRALAVTGGQRSSALPQVPTVEQAGVKGYGAIEQWWAVFAPAATPQPVIERLETLFNRIVGSEEAKTFLANGAAEPFPGNSVQLRELLSAEIKRWSELVQLAGIPAE
jgi:tripartite-type tricarboxylate transporter receptor subunit TctC